MANIEREFYILKNLVYKLMKNGGGGGGDGTVKVTADDTTADYLFNKLAAGTGISLTETTPSGDESVTITNTVVNTDESTKVSANDTTAGYLNGKLVAGTGITLTENTDGGNETLTVASTVVNTDQLAKVTANDTTAGYLLSKIVAGDNITITETNDGGNETLTIAGAEGGSSVTISDTAPALPAVGDLWWDSDGGNLYVWYNDGDSSQWVIAIQVTDGVNLVPVEESAVWTTGPQTFDLSDTPYNGYVGVYVNGVRIDKTDWSLSGLTLTILGTLEAGDEVTFDFFIVDQNCNGITEYASISELIVASEGSLAPGYYEVFTRFGRVVTFWTGTQFSPYPTFPVPNPKGLNFTQNTQVRALGIALENKSGVMPAGNPDISDTNTWSAV